MKSNFDLIFKKIELTPKLVDIVSKFNHQSETIINTYVNPYSIQLLEKDVINKLSNIFVDGITLVWLLNYTYKFNIQRSSFDLTSHADELFHLSEDLDHNLGLIGGTETEIKSSIEFFLKRYPKLNINFFSSGYIDEKNKPAVINELKDCDFIICGMGTPKQEEFMISLKEAYPVGKIIFSCGAFFTQTAQKGDYYHPLINKLNLRWVQRHFDSSEVRRRHFIEYPKFLYKFFKNLLN